MPPPGQTAEVDQEIKKAAEDGEQPSPANPNVDEVSVRITAKFKLDFAASSHLPFIAEGKKRLHVVYCLMVKFSYQ